MTASLSAWSGIRRFGERIKEWNISFNRRLWNVDNFNIIYTSVQGQKCCYSPMFPNTAEVACSKICIIKYQLKRDCKWKCCLTDWIILGHLDYKELGVNHKITGKKSQVIFFTERTVDFSIRAHSHRLSPGETGNLVMMLMPRSYKCFTFIHGHILKLEITLLWKYFSFTLMHHIN